jgi:hypothetical protein
LHSPVIIQGARPEIINTPLTFISMMRPEACSLPLYLLSWPIRILVTEATMPPCDSRKCKTFNYWHFVDAHLCAHLSDILTVIGCLTIEQKMPTVLIGSQYTVSTYCRLNPRSSIQLSIWATTIHVICMINNVDPSHFSAFGLAIYGIKIHALVLYIYSWTSSPFLIQLILLNFHDVPLARFNFSTACKRSEQKVM